jgi:transcriptional regulator with XRE-family HTH domain
MPTVEPRSGYWAKLIMSLRGSLLLSQCQFAETLGIDQTTVSRWERGLTEPQYDQRKALEGMAKDAGIATLGDLTNIVNFSPFPMILVDRWLMVFAASKCSGFLPNRSVADQTPDEELIFLQNFSEQLEAAGFWTGDCAKFDYAFRGENEVRRAVVVAITIRGQVFALVQKAW